MSLTFEQLEEPVLRWVFEHGDDGTGNLPFGSTEAFAGIGEVTQAQVADAIRRLQEHGLVAGTGPVVTNAYDRWERLRPTADGLRVLGEWPPAEGAAVNVALARILRGLADTDGVTDDECGAAKRAAGSLSQMAGDVVMDIAKDEMTKLAGGG